MVLKQFKNSLNTMVINPNKGAKTVKGVGLQDIYESLINSILNPGTLAGINSQIDANIAAL